MIKPQQLGLSDFTTNVEVAKKFDKKKKKSNRIEAVDKLDFQYRSNQLPPFVREYRFAAQQLDRQWRFDFCWQKYMVAVEVEGLVVKRIGNELVVTGGHASIQGMKDDMEKYNSAALLGWHVLRFEQSMVNSGHAISFTQQVLFARGWRR